ncbi:PadR family transcriptional regulator [Micromonospora sp. NPDC052213]|uniref:PadR family transcriptional regulator n=1 Tax=Micromonospora sp. NPDC052213 TaxID=3155812 RepID=UPI0034380D0E
MSYGTVYPLITRLHRLGLIANALQPSPNGPPRKVYRLTDTGHGRLRALARAAGSVRRRCERNPRRPSTESRRRP